MLQFAVDVLKVKHIMVVGHHGCSGVSAAVHGERRGFVDHRLHPIREVYHQDRLNRLCELSLITIRNGDGPEVRPRRTGRTERVSANASSQHDKTPLITNFISNWANAMPMQRRTPPPNGKYS
jgi:hypothetical protein